MRETLILSRPATHFPLVTQASPIEWQISPGLVPYPDAVAAMEARVGAVADGAAAEMVWLLEHPPLYT
ncbi:MAG: lipoyl(octanoyl) transferase LipB, partial [Micropepsaceae bacterium]